MIYAANFKMNHTRASTARYIETLEKRLSEAQWEERVLLFPPATALQASSGHITVGAQNAYMAQKGAYTGEIGLQQLEEFGIETILIGHSERRQLLAEEQEFVSRKFAWYKEAGFTIVYCIGEPIEVRESGEEAVAEYLWEQFDGIDIDYEKLIVAYEPIWAIGTGRSATVEEIRATHDELRRRISAPLLYGGSVKRENIASISAIENVDGVLVGSASLDAEEFFAMMMEGR
jgi:triosephosphate isomerase